jgi:hypothetical protein
MRREVVSLREKRKTQKDRNRRIDTSDIPDLANTTGWFYIKSLKNAR